MVAYMRQPFPLSATSNGILSDGMCCLMTCAVSLGRVKIMISAQDHGASQ